KLKAACFMCFKIRLYFPLVQTKVFKSIRKSSRPRIRISRTWFAKDCSVKIYTIVSMV
ncbi:AAA domain family protein, partial [Vibrio parahaemolyticus V-223/04]